MAGNDAQVQFQQNGGTRKWRYQGVAFDGHTKQKGTVEAQTRDQAIERIKKLGLYPTDLTDTTAGTGLNAEINIKALEKYPSKKDFAVMARQLATMVAAGVSLIRALNIVTEQIENQKLRKALQACVVQVEGGSSFSEAMAADPDSLFPPIMVNMIRAGETGGFLDKSLLTVADSFEADVKLQGQIKGALAYPIVVLCIALVIVAVMLLTIVPMFASMYSSMGAELPAITQIMVNMGKAAPVAIPIILVGVIAFAVFWKRNRNKDIIRTWWDPFTLKAPVFGKLDTNVALARFCNNFASMLSSGVPILQALDIVGSTSGNYVIDEASKRVSRLVERGYRLADSMSSEKIFPNMMVQMVAIGEDSGRHRPDARQRRQSLRRGGAVHGQAAHVAARTVDDSAPRRGGRIHHPGLVHADVRHVRRHQRSGMIRNVRQREGKRT